jgi:hypothetical protein
MALAQHSDLCRGDVVIESEIVGNESLCGSDLLATTSGTVLRRSNEEVILSLLRVAGSRLVVPLHDEILNIV